MTSEELFLKALIPNEDYFSEEAFQAEQLMFQKNWYYIGVSTDLENHNDFLTCNIGGKDVVVQNFKGELKAFHNVCTHRFNIIQTQRSGNRPMMCQYHGWNYNNTGIPFGIPLKNEFKGLDKESLNKLCLASFDLELMGKFVFVRIANEGLSLEEFLGETGKELLEISKMIGRKIEYNEIENEANWKVVVENTLEGYHITSVHPNTFYKQGFNLKSKAEFFVDTPHTSMLLQLSENAEKDKKREKFHKLLKDRPYQPGGFYHALIYPNLSIGSLFGISVYIGSIKSISPDKAVFAYDLFETKKNEGELLDETISSVIGPGAQDFTHITLSEDKEICEQVQLGLRQSGSAKGVLSNQETRIWEFQKAYLASLEK